MKLRLVGLSETRRGDLLATISAFTDDDEPFGFEDKVNLSSARDRERFASSLVEEIGVSLDQAREALVLILKEARSSVDGDDNSSTDHSATKSAGIERLGDPTLPSIEVNDRFLREITGDSIQALLAGNKPEPKTFLRGGAPARVKVGREGISIEALNFSAMRGVLDRSANYCSWDWEKASVKPARPPSDMVNDLLSLPELPLPPIRAVSGAPLFLAGGRLLIKGGYDRETGIYLFLNGLNAVSSMMPLEQACSLILDEVFVDFPFVDDGARAHAFGLLLQAFVRELITGPTPATLIEAPMPGSGKDLLAQAIAEIALGRPVETTAQPRDDDEARKRITSMLMEAQPMILLDNVDRLSGSSLCAVLTAETWQDRLLGVNRTVRVENRATWIATGNNVTLSGEMTRRVVLTRLDPAVERPEQRTGFRHKELIDWIRENRPVLVTACLSVVNAWVKAGMPMGKKTLGMFESYARVIGGITEFAGLPGFLSNRDTLYRQADTETQDWTALCEVWWQVFAEAPVTAGDLMVDVLKPRNMLLDLWAGRQVLSGQQRLGHALQRRVDAVFGQNVIRSAGRDGLTGNSAYRLERVKGRNMPGAETPETPDTPSGRR